ncbi:MAG: hypothetical protein WAU68_04980 [Vitreimonas sp.]
MTEDRLKKILQAALDQESGKPATIDSEDAEEAENAGYLEVRGSGLIALTDEGRIKLASFN